MTGESRAARDYPTSVTSVMFKLKSGARKHVHSSATQYPAGERAGIPRWLCQLCTGTRERMGLSTGVRPFAAYYDPGSRGAELPGNLFESAAGKSPAHHP